MICCRFDCGWQVWDRRNLARYFSILISNIFELEFQARSKIKKTLSRHEGGCKRNPIPGAPYSISQGTANKLTLAKFHAKLKK